MGKHLLKRDWSLTEVGFNKLLGALDPDRDGAAGQYEHLRRALIRYFDWRGSFSPESDADETIDRVAQKLAEQPVGDVYAYALGVARNVAHESIRIQSRQAELITSPPQSGNSPVDAAFERRIECCETCLKHLPREQRDLIIAYYEGEKQTKIANRQRLAVKTGVPINRLRLQVHRIREKLETCITQCLETKGEQD